MCRDKKLISSNYCNYMSLKHVPSQVRYSLRRNSCYFYVGVNQLHNKVFVNIQAESMIHLLIVSASVTKMFSRRIFGQVLIVLHTNSQSRFLMIHTVGWLVVLGLTAL